MQSSSANIQTGVLLGLGLGLWLGLELGLGVGLKLTRSEVSNCGSNIFHFQCVSEQWGEVGVGGEGGG